MWILLRFLGDIDIVALSNHNRARCSKFYETSSLYIIYAQKYCHTTRGGSGTVHVAIILHVVIWLSWFHWR